MISYTTILYTAAREEVTYMYVDQNRRMPLSLRECSIPGLTTLGHQFYLQVRRSSFAALMFDVRDRRS